MDEDIILGLFIGFMIGVICMMIMVIVVDSAIMVQCDNFADGLCKLKFGEDFEFKEFEWDDGTQEVLCREINEHDFDSVVIREG